MLDELSQSVATSVEGPDPNAAISLGPESDFARLRIGPSSDTDNAYTTPRRPAAKRSDLYSSPVRARSGTPSQTPTARERPLYERKGESYSTGPHATTPGRSPRAAFSDEQASSSGDAFPTRATVATQTLLAELGLGSGVADDGGHGGLATESGTVVILQDSCYGHRYSRLRTTKATLNMIVERPERIHAAVLGLAAAYVRLHARHSRGRFSLLPGGAARHSGESKVPFRIRKTRRSLPLQSPIVTNVHGAKWMEGLREMCQSAGAKLAAGERELARQRPTSFGGASGASAGAGAASPSATPALHEGDLYLSEGSLEAFEAALGGVCEGVDEVFMMNGGGSRRKHAFVCIRPPGHHCSAASPSGFCWLNNVHVGIEYAAQTYGLTHAAIIDFDLHHGDGSQAIAWEHNSRAARLPKNAPASKKTAIGYFSLHDINSYPCEDGNESKVRDASLCLEDAHGQTVWNVHLQPWATPDEFWDLYDKRYSVLIEKARNFLKQHGHRVRSMANQPQRRAAIFISAGFDASEWESPGMQRHKVSVPTDFYARFTKDIVQIASEEGTAVDGRIISVLEGGYSDRALTSGVLSHICGLCTPHPDLTPDVFSSTSTLGQLRETELLADVAAFKYDPCWWSPQSLDDVARSSATADDGPDANAGRRKVSQSTYYSPTQSSVAKAVGPIKLHRSLSSSSRLSSSSPPRPRTPPTDIDWAAASHALSQVLIPSDRQTRSCRPEELIDSRLKREKEANSGVATTQFDPTLASTRMQLRDRKAKVANILPVAAPIAAQARRPHADRRRTLGDALTASYLATEGPAPTPTAKHRRRLSVASTVSNTRSSLGSTAVGIPSSPPLDSYRPVSVGPKSTVAVSKTRKPRTVIKGEYSTQPVPLTNVSLPMDVATCGSETLPVLASLPSSAAIPPATAQVRAVPQSGRGSSATRGRGRGRPPGPVKSRSTGRTRAEPGNAATGTEMDDLASAVGRIRIKVPSGSKYQELQRQVAGAATSARTPPILPQTATETVRTTQPVPSLHVTDTASSPSALPSSSLTYIDPNTQYSSVIGASSQRAVAHGSTEVRNSRDDQTLQQDQPSSYPPTLPLDHSTAQPQSSLEVSKPMKESGNDAEAEPVLGGDTRPNQGLRQDETGDHRNGTRPEPVQSWGPGSGLVHYDTQANVDYYRPASADANANEIANANEKKHAMPGVNVANGDTNQALQWLQPTTAATLTSPKPKPRAKAARSVPLANRAAPVVKKASGRPKMTAESTAKTASAAGRPSRMARQTDADGGAATTTADAIVAADADADADAGKRADGNGSGSRADPDEAGVGNVVDGGAGLSTGTRSDTATSSDFSNNFKLPQFSSIGTIPFGTSR